MRKTLLAFLFILGSALPATAQTIVSGTVADAANYAYSGAVLTVTQNGFVVPPTAVLNSSGQFSINLTAGSGYTFNASFAGVAAPLGTGPQTCTLSNQTISGATQTLSFSSCPALTNISASTGVSSVTATTPVASSGGSTPNITIGTVPVSKGGTGATTLSGPLKGNGTSAIGAAAYTDIAGLWTTGGTCSSTTFLRGDGSCITPSGSVSGGTSGFIPLFGSATSITGNSHMDDGITTASVITSTEAIVAPTVTAGTAPAGIASNAGGGFGGSEGASTGWTPTSGVDYLRADSTSHRWLMSNNGGSETAVVGPATTDTLTNKSISGAEINSGTVPTAQLPVGSGSAQGIVQCGTGITCTAGTISVSPAPTITAVDLTAQAANISATTLVTPAANGFYSFQCYTVITQAATSTSELPYCAVLYTDADSNVTQAQLVTNEYTTNTVGQVGSSPASNSILSAPAIIYAKSGVAIQYRTQSYASTGATPMQYAIHVRLIGPF